MIALAACALAFRAAAADGQPGVASPAEAPALPTSPPLNLLLNPGLDFHAFESARTGKATAFRSGEIPGWDQNAYRDAEVYRAPQVREFRPLFPVDNLVVIHPGKRLSQFVLLSEAGLDPGDRVSLSVFGQQSQPGALRAVLSAMQTDGAPGDWSPATFGQDDKRTFAACVRGELTPVPIGSALSGASGGFELRLENVEISGIRPAQPLPLDPAAPENQRPHTIGLTVEFANLANRDLWIYSPCLVGGPAARNRLPAARPLPSLYRHLPRTMQKLWRGEPLHILQLGYSSDHGDANPPLYLYDEDPQSPTFKQPLQREFDGTKVGHPEWNDYIVSWNLYFSAWGRTRAALLRRFDLPINRIMHNVMACGGSFVREAHSGYADYAALALPPGYENGHRPGKTWQALYPEVCSRPEGPVPDLVTLGYGKNWTSDPVDEIEQYEGAIRWFQRHYPNVEFILSVNDWREGFVENTAALKELSLRYQIPFIDFGKALHLASRHGPLIAPVPGDAHPQAYAHYLWSRELERAFAAVDPIEPGSAQLRLPERLSPHTLGWEGDIRTYTAPCPRLRRDTGFILDDTVVNLWATSADPKVQVCVDGQPRPNNLCTPMARRDIRNSTFATGRLTLGDRHIVEVTGPEARLVATDAKIVPDRQWIGVESPRWQLAELRPQAFESDWGAPYGTRQVMLPAGKSVTLAAVGTFFSVAYVDRPDGGTLQVQVDGRDALRQPTHTAFRTATGQELWLENRRGMGPLPYGLHTLQVTASDGPLALLGVFSYDTRSNRMNERILRGTAAPGESISFSPPFRATPLVFCTGALSVATADLTPDTAKFSGSGTGSYEIVGE
jgi:hypothetical protein